MHYYYIILAREQGRTLSSGMLERPPELPYGAETPFPGEGGAAGKAARASARARLHETRPGVGEGARSYGGNLRGRVACPTRRQPLAGSPARSEGAKDRTLEQQIRLLVIVLVPSRTLEQHPILSSLSVLDGICKVHLDGPNFSQESSDVYPSPFVLESRLNELPIAYSMYAET